MGIDPSFRSDPGDECSNSRHCLADPYEGSIIIICTSRQHGKNVLNILDKKKANEADILSKLVKKAGVLFAPKVRNVC